MISLHLQSRGEDTFLHETQCAREAQRLEPAYVLGHCIKGDSILGQVYACHGLGHKEREHAKRHRTYGHENFKPTRVANDQQQIKDAYRPGVATCNIRRFLPVSDS